MSSDGNQVIDVKKISKVPGLYVIKNLISKDNGKIIINKLDTNGKWKPLSLTKNSRKVQQYGFEYHYKSGNIKVPTDPMPDYIYTLSDKLTYICKKLDIIDDSYNFNQCIVNNYNKGQAISAHIDKTDYGKVIGCYTVGTQAAIMAFTLGSQIYELKAKPNSLYIMSGDARWKWKHEMLPLKSFQKPLKKDSDRNTIPRRISTKEQKGIIPRRISITFRQV